MDKEGEEFKKARYFWVQLRLSGHVLAEAPLLCGCAKPDCGIRQEFTTFCARIGLETSFEDRGYTSAETEAELRQLLDRMPEGPIKFAAFVQGTFDGERRAKKMVSGMLDALGGLVTLPQGARNPATDKLH